MKAICEFRAKVNDALNDSIAKMGQYILIINSCNAYEHFDRSGNLSIAGKKAFWMELDDLIRRFDGNKVKLLPNPKNLPGKKFQFTTRYERGECGEHWQNVHRRYDSRNYSNRRRLPTPPPEQRNHHHKKFY